ncbi:hypothetical protein AA12717_4137 [Gluconacetobacter sacchari DSM 12717]|uniref:Uncharacterized protein n=2 Tax=Gluconacetobacter sacchari TaxID=92759 RepID=A0A7W4NU13_9PROT|nr:hypothetical protein [Gluconacetobacter sacchari]MBB2162870.1 hypothetical protein [Gluconacetobacter sacchari]GBQ33347.1 hypothetical protein AA12717_4137 [Gluconacetobacter sacchari DSM 12717]
MFVSAATTYTGNDRSSVADSATNGKVASTATGQVDQTDTSAVLVTLSQTGLDFLKGASPDSGAALSAQQEAVTRLDQMIQSGRQFAKEAAEERVNMLNAQMRLLMEMKALLSPKALALEVAQLTTQLAAAVAQYVQSGGTNASGSAVGSMVLATPQDGGQAPSGADQAATDGTDLDAQQAATGATRDSDGSDPMPRQAVTAGQSGASADGNPEFQQAVIALASQMKALLRESKEHLKKQDVTSDSNLQSAQNALDTVDQLLPTVS